MSAREDRFLQSDLELEYAIEVNVEEVPPWNSLYALVP